MGFSCLGHLYIHMMTAFYFVIVLTLEIEWERSYDELFQLWTLGSILLGVMAIPAGRLADWWSVRAVMVLYFIGLGGASIACGLAEKPIPLMIGLAGIGLFGAIYHPVGIPWLIRNARRNTGKLLAVNGIFGGLGNASAGIIAGVLIDFAGWRSAFIVPGVVCLGTGVLMLYFIARGDIDDGAAEAAPDRETSREDLLRVIFLLLMSLAVGGIIYQATQGALPKLFSVRLGDIVGEGATGVGALVSVVYTMGAGATLLGGYLADRFPLKPIYVICWLLEVVMLSAIAVMSGFGLIGAAILSVTANFAMSPAENMLLYRYAPARHRSLVFGIKFVIAFSAAPLSIMLISWVWAATGEFAWLFGGLAAATLMVALLLFMLPSDKAAVTVAAE